MLEKFIVSLAAFLLAFVASSRAEEMRIGRLDLTEGQTERIEVPASVDRILLERIVLQSQPGVSPSATKIGIEGASQCQDGVNHEVEIVIGDIIAGPEGPRRSFSLNFENITLQKLRIDQSPNRAGQRVLTSIIFDDCAQVLSANILNGFYRDIHLRIQSPRLLQDKSGKIPAVGSFSFNVESISSLVMNGKFANTPATIDFRSKRAGLPSLQGAPRLSISNLRLLNAAFVIEDLGRAGMAPTFDYDSDACTGDSHRMLIEFLSISLGDTRSIYQNRSQPSGLSIVYPDFGCLELFLSGFVGAGDISVEGGVLGDLAFDDIQSEGARGLSFTSRTTGIKSLRLASATLSNFTMSAGSRKESSMVSIPVWGSIRINGTVALPSKVYEELNNLLIEHDRTDATATGGVRRFLTASIWDSYFSDNNRSASGEALYYVLKSDSRRIFGFALSAVLDWLTGFGLKLLRPIVSFIGFGLALMILAIVWPDKEPRSWSTKIVQFTRGALPFSQDGEVLCPARNCGVAVRYTFAVQFALVSLFIQNAILVGS